MADGLALAKKSKLPDIVTDFIVCHHGRSLTLYFYNVYCNGGGDPANKEPFTYQGKLPRTKEQVVVMMADAVEAASRSLKDYSEASISALVEKIMANRWDGENGETGILVWNADGTPAKVSVAFGGRYISASEPERGEVNADEPIPANTLRLCTYTRRLQ